MGPVLHIRSDRFNHQIELVGAVDLPKGAIDLVRCDLLGFGEVVQPVDSLGVAILHDEHEAGTALRPRKQREVVGAEVKHDGMTQRWLGGGTLTIPSPSAAPLWG